jgi:hypothetical protein
MGCDLINPAEPIPTRIHLQPFEFQIQPGQGSGQNRITEVWVYANSNVLGAFTPPVTIHYVDRGQTQFTFRPGIRNNGILEDAIVYPLFDGYSVDFNAEPGAELHVQPVTQYNSEAFFSLIADFEASNEFVDDRDTVAASRVIQSAVDVFEGVYSGQIIMSAEATYIEVGHALPMTNLPTNGKAAYLEFRYKSEVEMSIGILGINLSGQSFSQFFYLVKPSAEWNMLYIELTEFLRLAQLPAYKILFRSLYPPGAPEPEYHIFLDNIKVVHL